MALKKTILEKLKDISIEAAANTTFAQTLADLAVDAISEGKGSAAWVKYMKVIVESGGNPADITTSKQLQRLSFKDPNPLINVDFKVNRNNIYIVANAVCGMGTTTRTRQSVEDGYGDDLGEE